MKKKLQLLLILLLTYGFICCPVFAGSSFAETTGTGRNREFGAFFQTAFDSIVSTAQFITENMSGWVQELTLPTSVEDFQANRETVKVIRDQISEKLGRPWMNRPTRD